jgi:hypothetical protein
MTLAGVWQNEYNSQMTLSEVNTNLVVGTYASTTGSSGEYYVIGWQTTAEPTASAGQPVCLAIDWHSIVAGPSDNSWHWTSGLSGQINIVNTSEQLVLAHAMIASCDFPGLCVAGNYIDKLTYNRVSHEAPEPLSLPNTEGDGDAAPSLVGTWLGSDGTVFMVQSVTPYTGNAFGLLYGKMTWHGGPSMIYGLTDINAASAGLALQSVSIVGLPSAGGGPAITYAGTLDLASGTMTLVELSSTSTPNSATYVQTTVGQVTFKKQ